MKDKKYNPRDFLRLETQCRVYNRDVFVLRENQIDYISNLSILLGEIQSSEVTIELELLEIQFSILSNEIANLSGKIVSAETMLKMYIEQLETFFL
jgi:hypothetical protein